MEVNASEVISTCLYLLVQSIQQDKLAHDNGGPLEVDCLPAGVVQVGDVQHQGVCELGQLREEPLKVGEERGVVESPF